MSDPTDERRPYRVLVPVSDNEESAMAQARFVAGLPDAAASVEATLTHVLHGEEMRTSREGRSAQRIGTVKHVRKHLEGAGVTVAVRDVEYPSPPPKGILALADTIDADLVVLGGGMHSLLEDLVSGHVARSVGRHTDRPIAVVRAPARGTEPDVTASGRDETD